MKPELKYSIYATALDISSEVWQTYKAADIYYLLNEALHRLRIYRTKRVRTRKRAKIVTNAKQIDPYNPINMKFLYAEVWEQIEQRNKFDFDQCQRWMMQGKYRHLHVCHRDDIREMLRNGIKECMKFINC
jgi:hypothetical protein